LDAEVDINNTWESIGENIKISAQDNLISQRMLKIIRSKETSQTAVVTWPSKINGDNLNNVRREAGRHFRNKKM
jgi:hypothetical protein